MSEAKINVLLIEDNPGDAMLIEEYLSEMMDPSCNIEIKEKLSTGLHSLKNGEIDLILLDMTLPDSNGLDSLNEIKKINTKVPIVILTGLTDQEVSISALKNGAQDYLIKDEIDENILIRSIRFALERKQNIESKIIEEEQKRLQIENLYGELINYTEELKTENISLKEELRIEPMQEISQVSLSELDYQIELGTIYLFPERDITHPINIYYDFVTQGFSGLIISRIPPEKIKKIIPIHDSPIIWLNNSLNDEKKLYLQPNLEILLHLIRKYMKEIKEKEGKAIIYFGGLEYLILYNGFSQTLKFFELLNDIIYLFQSIMLVSIDPSALMPNEFALVRRFIEKWDEKFENQLNISSVH